MLNLTFGKVESDAQAYIPGMVEDAQRKRVCTCKMKVHLVVDVQEEGRQQRKFHHV